MVAGGRMRKGIIRELGMDMYTLLYLKWITNKDLLYSTWNSAQSYVAAWAGEEFGREFSTGKSRGQRSIMGSSICMAESLHCSPETITTLLISYTLTQNLKV